MATNGNDEVLKKVKSLLDILNQKRSDLQKIDENMSSMVIMRQRAAEVVDGARKELRAELKKLDPGLDLILVQDHA